MQNSLFTWKEDFLFQGKRLFYNRIQYNNFAERAVEIPIAFEFLATREKKSTPLEIGNVLRNYENALSDHLGIRPRRILDKYEVDLGIENIDLMDLPGEEKFWTIVSISTIEHIGQGRAPLGDFGENMSVTDREAPLKAIAKIYDLLQVGGKALITVPFGKLTDGDWYIQFSPDYLQLLLTKFGIPQAALSLHFLKRIATERTPENPYQLWREAEQDEVSDIEYNSSWDGAGALAIIELTKISEKWVLSLHQPSTPLHYELPILVGSVYYSRFTYPTLPDRNGEIRSEKRGLIFHGAYLDAPIGEYELTLSLNIDGACDLLFDVLITTANRKAKALKHYIHSSSHLRQRIQIVSDQSHIEFRLFNRSGSSTKIHVEKFLLRKVKSDTN